MNEEGREFEDAEENSEGAELDAVSETEVIEPLLEWERPKLNVGEDGVICEELFVVRRN